MIIEIGNIQRKYDTISVVFYEHIPLISLEIAQYFESNSTDLTPTECRLLAGFLLNAADKQDQQEQDNKML